MLHNKSFNPSSLSLLKAARCIASGSYNAWVGTWTSHSASGCGRVRTNDRSICTRCWPRHGLALACVNATPRNGSDRYKQQRHTYTAQFAWRAISATHVSICTAPHVSAHRCGCAIRMRKTNTHNTLRARYGACGPGRNPTYARPWRVTQCRTLSSDPVRGNMRPTTRIDD